MRLQKNCPKKDSREAPTSRNKWGLKKILNVWLAITWILHSNHIKITVFMVVLNGESESISTCIRCIRELKGLGLSSCVALRKPLISETNWEKRLQIAREHKDWTLEKWKVMWSDESRVSLFQSDGYIRVRREEDAAMHPLSPLPPVQACRGSSEPGLPQLVRSMFSYIMCPKNEVSWLHEYTEWQGYSISEFLFFPEY